MNSQWTTPFVFWNCRRHQFSTRSFCSYLLYTLQRTVAILFRQHSKSWVVVQNPWFIPGYDVCDESLPLNVVSDQKLFPVFFSVAFILFCKNFGTHLVHNHLYSRSLTNLLTVARPTSVIWESHHWVIRWCSQFFFLLISAQISALRSFG